MVCAEWYTTCWVYEAGSIPVGTLVLLFIYSTVFKCIKFFMCKYGLFMFYTLCFMSPVWLCDVLRFLFYVRHQSKIKSTTMKRQKSITN